MTRIIITALIACGLTLGIGYLWLAPYQNMTYTMFYLELMEKKNE